MERVLTCLLNEKAGSGGAGRVRALVERAAGERGWQARVVTCKRGTNLTDLADKARDSSEMVVAAGGDGTVAGVAAALVGTDTVLGVLPVGTLNHFAKDMRIPLDLEGAVQNLFDGKVVKVDVGEVNGRVFLNNSSIGFYPRIVRTREYEQRRGTRKWVAFAKAAARILRKAGPLHVAIEDDQGRKQAHDTAFLFVGNNRYALSGREIGSRPGLDGGKLWVCSAPNARRLDLFLLALQTALGMGRDASLVAFESGLAEVQTGRRHLHVATDGEVTLMQSPLNFRSRPGALCVRVPN